ncbi:alpha-ketoacid dehydrogenase subunit beta [Alicyclobacillus tolerans]|uniref:alpha-ketoacid dehydrogenase subunit beta n=1 Tax=Alicyclobacillus TaxID=29330 RepID=UPI001AFC435C|nr:alpha-ketoacid dehydrogenase subunit beta [Alicyclobacillus sp. TC]QRF24088.1 alpha-ketoacid dehydrogenase subunit beta [Alicyclobacillus sp. TC]
MTRMLNMVQAIRDALDVKLAEDNRVLVLGEDVGVNGGVFRATDGLQDKYGPERVIDTPLAESGIIGSSIGLALNGFRPVAEIQFLAFIFPGLEQVFAHAARMRYRTRGRFTAPLVIRAPYGAGIRGPELHSESLESLFAHTPGLRVVAPSNPYDAKGMLISAMEVDDPVIFLEPTRLYRAGTRDVPEGSYRVSLEKAERLTEGRDVSLFAWGAMVPVALRAAEQLEKEQGLSAEVIDLRSLMPLDKETILSSVEKTGRAVIVHEAHQTAGLGAEIAALLADEAVWCLRAPIKRVAGFDVPVPPFSVEDAYLPTAERVLAGLKEVVMAE